jgi:hypothetical protein
MSLYDDDAGFDEEFDEDTLSPSMREVADDLDGEDADEIDIEFNQDHVAANGGTQEIGMGTGRDERLEWLEADQRAADEYAATHNPAA